MPVGSEVSAGKFSRLSAPGLRRDGAMLAYGHFDLGAMAHGIPCVAFRRWTDRRVGISLVEQLSLSLFLGQPRCIFALTGHQQQDNGC